jgi:uncharacterized FAD-dependent dehydrogenase
MYRIDEIRLSIGEDISVIPERVIEKLDLDKATWRVSDWRVARKSVDARDNRCIRFVYAVRFDIENKDRDGIEIPARVKALSDEVAMPQYDIPGCIADAGEVSKSKMSFSSAPRPVIAGFGPCGIFAAYVLAKAGLRPIVLERGRPVEERRRHAAAFWKEGVFDENSNVLFGEGGAGTFSDGKLTTGIGDPRKAFVYKTFVEAGGGDDLLRLNRPHLGTDVLFRVIQNLRAFVLNAGGDIRFGCKLAGIGTDKAGGVAMAVTENTREETADKTFEEIETDRIILAVGHSARDTMKMLFDHGVAVEQKPFSMGVRVEHPQSLINEAQYGRNFESLYGMGYREAGLPPAEYKLSHKCKDGRGVYTFCMCPGGSVIAVASEPRGVCTNGMSERARDGSFANSAVLVDVRLEDFGDAHPLAGCELQRKAERAAFSLKGDYSLFSETLEDFASEGSALAACLPSFVSRDIMEAIPVFGRRIKGFDAADTRVYGPETRSSSPVRIPRGADMQCNISGLYPCGEGAGWAGGIVSAAADGVRVAERVIAELS